MSVLRNPTLLLVGLVAVFALACATLVLVIFGGRRGPTGDGFSSAELGAEFAPLPIAADDLFKPAEPDFLPDLIRYRERRTTWTAADAAPFWTDPADLDQKPLTDAAAAVVDRLLEAVP